MTSVKMLLKRAREKIRDTDSIEYTDSELIDCYNEASDQMSSFLIGIKNAEMIKSIVVEGSIDKPPDFDSIVGSQMLYLENDKIKTLSGDSLLMRYYAIKPHLSGLDDAIPFKSSIEPLLVQYTAISALNNNEYDVSQDMMLFEKNKALLVNGK